MKESEDEGGVEEVEEVRKREKKAVEESVVVDSKVTTAPTVDDSTFKVMTKSQV